jgi:CBS domain-containing protein
MESTGSAHGEYWFEDPSRVGAAERQGYVAALVRIAALDGLTETEDRIVRAAAEGLGLDAAGLERAWQAATDLATPSDRLIGSLRDGGLRACLIRDAYRIAAADGTVSRGEVEELARLAEFLGVAPAHAPPARHDLAARAPPATAEAAADEPGVHPAAEEIAAAIRSAPDVDGLLGAFRSVQELGHAMVHDGASAAQVTRTLSEMSDRIAERVIEIEVAGEPLGDVRFCWISLGSEGRREQTLLTDQDNGIVFDPGEGGSPDGIRARLLPIAQRINRSLARCGFPLCKGNVMAGNPEWCLALEEWKDRFTRWMGEPRPEALLNATIFFDFRPIWGDLGLAAALREFLVHAAPGNRRFLAILAGGALERRPPLGMFRDFAVDGAGDEAGTVDLKAGAAALFVDAARVYGLATGATDPATTRRLRVAGERAGVDGGDVEGWVEAFQFVQVLRLRHQLELARAGRPQSNRLDPYRLNPLERKFFRESLRQGAALQKHLGRKLGVSA